MLGCDPAALAVASILNTCSRISLLWLRAFHQSSRGMTASCSNPIASICGTILILIIEGRVQLSLSSCIGLRPRCECYPSDWAPLLVNPDSNSSQRSGLTDWSVDQHRSSGVEVTLFQQNALVNGP